MSQIHEYLMPLGCGWSALGIGAASFLLFSIARLMLLRCLRVTPPAPIIPKGDALKGIDLEDYKKI